MEEVKVLTSATSKAVQVTRIGSTSLRKHAVPKSTSDEQSASQVTVKNFFGNPTTNSESSRTLITPKPGGDNSKPIRPS